MAYKFTMIFPIYSRSSLLFRAPSPNFYHSYIYRGQSYVSAWPKFPSLKGEGIQAPGITANVCTQYILWTEAWAWVQVPGLLTLTFPTQHLEPWGTQRAGVWVRARAAALWEDVCGHSCLLGSNLSNGSSYKSIMKSFCYRLFLPTLNPSRGIRCSTSKLGSPSQLKK